MHELSQRATTAYENARKTAQKFLNASRSEEIVFTKGTTDGINTVARSWAVHHLQKGDEIIISTLEHHSNIVPWQMICEITGARLIVTPINQKGEIKMEEFEKRLSSKTKLLAISHVSNTLGTINPIHEMVELARKHNCRILIDAAQSAPHFALDVQKIDCDFLVLVDIKHLPQQG